jgi:leader peptidase (prepilin peptidase) / N-methyltransferase
VASIHYIFVIAIGLVIGSFLNVIIDRIPRQESIIWPASHCPICGRDLPARDLIPIVNYLLLGGCCRYCQEPIPLRCPVVELLTPVSFGLIYLKSGISVETGAGWIFSAMLLTVACTDIEEEMIPDFITYPGLVIGLLLAHPTIGLQPAFVGLVLFAGALLAVAVLSKGGMGGGDIKLAGVIGAFLGPVGAGMTLVISSLTGGLWAAYLLGQGKAERKSTIRFGPFLAGAAWLVWMYQDEIFGWYMRQFI